jgi:hypothetical protein
VNVLQDMGESHRVERVRLEGRQILGPSLDDVYTVSCCGVHRRLVNLETNDGPPKFAHQQEI